MLNINLFNLALFIKIIQFIILLNHIVLLEGLFTINNRIRFSTN